MGIAAMLPGLQLALDVLSAQIEEYRALLRTLQAENGQPVKRKVGRPRKNPVAQPAQFTLVQAPAKTTRNQAERTAGMKAYWAKMTPNQRRAEMHRRAAKGLGRKGSKAKAAAA